MTLSINGSVASFLLAVLVYFLLNVAVETWITEEPARKSFKMLLLVLCLFIAIAGAFLIKL